MRLIRLALFFALAFTATAVTGPVSAPASAADGTPVSKEDMIALVKGKTVKAKIRSPQGILAYTAKLHEDGLIETKLDYHPARDKGKWTIEDGLYCAQYTKFRYGKKNCWQFLQTGPGEYLMKGLNGAKDQTVKVADADTLIVRSK
jgi:hypothetical protein